MTTVSLSSDTSAGEKVVIPLRALVVDDNVASAQTMGWMLEHAGHKVFLAHNGLQAIEAARTYKPHVILLDIGMPGMNGYDVCLKLRNDPLFKDITIIAQTGWGQEQDLALSTEAGFHYHLIKPIKYEHLMSLIAEIQDNLGKPIH